MAVAHRVVITGLGALTPYGEGVPLLWKGLLSLQSCLKWNAALDKVVGSVQEESCPLLYSLFTTGQRREMGTTAAWAVAAAEQALSDANAIDLPHEDTVVNVGTGVIDLEFIGETALLVAAGKKRQVSPFFVPRILNNLPAAHVAMRFGFRGGAECVSTACASGAQSIGQVFSRIRMRALARGDSAVSCPFDERRSGFVMSEGAGLVFMERLTDAMERGSNVYAEIIGFGTSSDTTHITSPPQDGSGLRLAMQRALKDAKTTPDQVNYVNAHATSTKVGDAAEAKAISSLFPHSPPVSSNKGHLGHLLAAAAAVETIATVLSLRNSMLPCTLNLASSDCAQVNHVIRTPKELPEQRKNIALVNSSGFGGTNAVLVLQRSTSQ